LDRPGAFARALSLAAAAFLVAAATPRPALKAERWLAPGTDRAAVLGAAPAECLPAIRDPERRWRVEVGRAAFRSPLVLGGQAAKAGLSCNACHRSGRDNPAFQFPGLSGAPGTADVTSFLMSSKRGDDRADPRPIPDLSGPGERLKVPRDGQALETFVHGLVTEEFEGLEPPAAVMDGLVAYVRALSPAACPKAATRPVTVADTLEDARRALRAADGALARRDSATAQAMVLAARDALGRIDERFADPSLQGERAFVRVSDFGLAALRQAMRSDDPGARRLIAEWIAASADLERRLVRVEDRSLFNPARLR
jgi:hypothetical protein